MIKHLMEQVMKVGSTQCHDLKDDHGESLDLFISAFDCEFVSLIVLLKEGSKFWVFRAVRDQTLTPTPVPKPH